VNINLLFQFFLSGLILGSSLCLLSCPFFLFPIIARESKTWKEGIKIGLIFGTGRIFSYGILGSIASFSHFLLQDFLGSKISFIIGGVILICIGFWFFFYSETCRKNYIIKKISTFLIGITYGILPCAPLTGFLFTYLVYMSKGILFGFISGIIFGLGTLLSPLLILCGFFPSFGKRINKFSKGKIYIKIIGTIIFIFFGIDLILKGVK